MNRHDWTCPKCQRANDGDNFGVTCGGCGLMREGRLVAGNLGYAWPVGTDHWAVWTERAGMTLLCKDAPKCKHDADRTGCEVCGTEMSEVALAAGCRFDISLGMLADAVPCGPQA